MRLQVSTTQSTQRRASPLLRICQHPGGLAVLQTVFGASNTQSSLVQNACNI